MASKGTFINNVRTQAEIFLDSIEEIGALTQEYDSLNIQVQLDDDDFGPDSAHSDITQQEFKQAITAFEQIIDEFFAVGNTQDKRIYKLKR